MMPDTLCVGSTFGTTEGQDECGSCYHINMAVVIGIIACDIVLTVFITISVFCFVRAHSRRRDLPNVSPPERSVQSPVSNKMSTGDTESPYQELQGVQSDVYSELHHFRK